MTGNKEDLLESFVESDRHLKSYLKEVEKAGQLYHYASNYCLETVADVKHFIKTNTENESVFGTFCEPVYDEKRNAVKDGKDPMCAVGIISVCIDVDNLRAQVNGRTVFQENADFSEKYLSANGAAARDALVAEVIKQRQKGERELRRRIAEELKKRERRRFIQLRKKFVGG